VRNCKKALSQRWVWENGPFSGRWAPCVRAIPPRSTNSYVKLSEELNATLGFDVTCTVSAPQKFVIFGLCGNIISRMIDLWASIWRSQCPETFAPKSSLIGRNCAKPELITWFLIYLSRIAQFLRKKVPRIGTKFGGLIGLGLHTRNPKFGVSGGLCYTWAGLQRPKSDVSSSSNLVVKQLSYPGVLHLVWKLLSSSFRFCA